MSIIGPQETHDYRNYNLLGSGTIKSPQKKAKKLTEVPGLGVLQVAPEAVLGDKDLRLDRHAGAGGDLGVVSDRLGRVRRAERLHVAELVDWDGGRVESEVDLARDGGETDRRETEWQTGKFVKK